MINSLVETLILKLFLFYTYIKVKRILNYDYFIQ